MPHTRSPPFRRRSSWTSLLSISTLLVLISTWLPSVLADKTAADYYIHSLPGAPEPLLKMHAGHIEITPEHHGNMFFWLYKNRHIGGKQRTVIWLNGGPGCSSMDGALMEIGPYRVNEDGTLRYNEGSWDEFANILFVDNPLGTGFSYVDGDSYLHDLDQMAADMIKFLEKWFAIFPEYEHDDLYIAGESFAGQHIPYVAQAILDRNAAAPSTSAHWHVAGLLIGNGWISGPEQYISYIPFLYEAGILRTGTQADRNARKKEQSCIEALDAGGKDHVDVGTCESIMGGLNRDLSPDGQCYNVYDVRLMDTWPACGMNWPPDLTAVTPYLRRDDVTAALHIDEDKKTGWKECNGQVGAAFNTAHSRPSKVLLPGLLEQMPIILFSGDKDLICNHIGTENIIKNLEWNGAQGMGGAAVRDWTFDGEPAGQWQTARNLTYLRFYNSSHMVPFNYPKRTRDMLDRFIGLDLGQAGGSAKWDSHIEGDGDKESQPFQPPVSSQPVDPEEEDAVTEATWAAYRRSGEAALTVVIIAALVWGYFVWRGRRKRGVGYRGVAADEPYDDRPSGGRAREARDIEAAADYDEAELDDLSALPANGHAKGDAFGLADDEDSEDDVGRRVNGRVS